MPPPRAWLQLNKQCWRAKAGNVSFVKPVLDATGALVSYTNTFAVMNQSIVLGPTAPQARRATLRRLAATARRTCTAPLRSVPLGWCYKRRALRQPAD